MNANYELFLSPDRIDNKILHIFIVMDRFIGISSAFGAGALDTVENIAVNLLDKVRSRKPKPVAPLSGKVMA